MGIPGVMLMVPLYMMSVKLHLGRDNPLVLILIYVFTGIPFTMFYLTGFFSSLPKELNESGMVDGCTHISAFWRIMFPLASPGVVSVTIFNFIGYWNEYMWALIFVNTTKRRTLALGLQAIVESMRYKGDWASLFAAIVIIFVPTFILFILLSEKIISGITAGAVKG
jgi:N-acetylglucosamine transport system permease protein